MSNRKTLGATSSAISSPVSADGPTRSSSQDGQKTGQYGPGAAPVSRFRAQGNEKAMSTNDTYGPIFNALSPSADLQRSLENRLRARMGANGLPLYALIWKSWDMPAGLPICALAGVGAPHIRQRLWWVADATGERGRAGAGRQDGEKVGNGSGLADSGYAERRQRDRPRDVEGGNLRRQERQEGSTQLGECGPTSGLGDTNQPGPQGRREHLGEYADQLPAWAASEFIPCADGKARPVEPGIFPLAHGVPGRVGRLRAYGNAIVPQVAAEFVRAFVVLDGQ